MDDHIIDVDTITNTVEKRRICVWYESFENFYDGILQVANMQSFFKEHSAGFHTAEAKNIWKEYTESYYQMDTYYRLFHLSFQKSLEVHGGISLQEMVVPVIEYHYLRNDSMEYKRNKQKYDTKPVTVNLLSANC